MPIRLRLKWNDCMKIAICPNWYHNLKFWTIVKSNRFLSTLNHLKLKLQSTLICDLIASRSETKTNDKIGIHFRLLFFTIIIIIIIIVCFCCAFRIIIFSYYSNLCKKGYPSRPFIANCSTHSIDGSLEIIVFLCVAHSTSSCCASKSSSSSSPTTFFFQSCSTFILYCFFCSGSLVNPWYVVSWIAVRSVCANFIGLYFVYCGNKSVLSLPFVPHWFRSRKIS